MVTPFVVGTPVTLFWLGRLVTLSGADVSVTLLWRNVVVTLFVVGTPVTLFWLGRLVTLSGADVSVTLLAWEAWYHYGLWMGDLNPQIEWGLSW